MAAAQGRGTIREGWSLGDPDREALREGYRLVCGVDEVGRGPLAGPVVAAAVVLPPGTSIAGLNDSKRINPSARASLLPKIREAALAIGIGTASAEEIDRLNILRASLLAMARAIQGLCLRPDFLLVDGLHPVPLPFPQKPIVRGDARSICIAAASNVAKEHRDALMRDYGRAFPGYGFEDHMGYPTQAHRSALARLGPTPLHRKTFRGVRETLNPGLFPDT